MTIKNIIGAAMIILLFLGLFSYMVSESNFAVAAKTFGATLLISAFVFLAVYLLVS